MMEIFSSADFWKVTIPLLGAVIAWLVNERRKHLWEQYIRKETSYKELIRCLRGFYEGTKDSHLTGEFLNQINICWLDCPDIVIKKSYEFLDLVAGKCTGDKEKAF